MYIATYTGTSNALENAIAEAERHAELTLNNIGPAEIVSIQAQTLIDRFTELGNTYTHYIHIITVAYD